MSARWAVNPICAAVAQRVHVVHRLKRAAVAQWVHVVHRLKRVAAASERECEWQVLEGSCTYAQPR